MLYILIILVICMGVHTYIGYIFYSIKDDEEDLPPSYSAAVASDVAATAAASTAATTATAA